MDEIDEQITKNDQLLYKLNLLIKQKDEIIEKLTKENNLLKQKINEQVTSFKIEKGSLERDLYTEKIKCVNLEKHLSNEKPKNIIDELCHLLGCSSDEDIIKQIDNLNNTILQLETRLYSNTNVSGNCGNCKYLKEEIEKQYNYYENLLMEKNEIYQNKIIEISSNKNQTQYFYECEDLRQKLAQAEKLYNDLVVLNNRTLSEKSTMEKDLFMANSEIKRLNEEIQSRVDEVNKLHETILQKNQRENVQNNIFSNIIQQINKQIAKENRPLYTSLVNIFDRISAPGNTTVPDLSSFFKNMKLSSGFSGNANILDFFNGLSLRFLDIINSRLSRFEREVSSSLVKLVERANSVIENIEMKKERIDDFEKNDMAPEVLALRIENKELRRELEIARIGSGGNVNTVYLSDHDNFNSFFKRRS